MTNKQLAERLVAEADACTSRRKALLCAAVAVGTTTSIRAAARAMADWDGPPAIRDQAIEIITGLEES
jgi:hypothetical protein